MPHKVSSAGVLKGRARRVAGWEGKKTGSGSDSGSFIVRSWTNTSFPWASSFSYKMSSQIDWPKSTIQVLTTLLVPLS